MDELFSGDDVNQNPQQFLRNFCRDQQGFSDQEKARHFRNYLVAGSPADQWFADITLQHPGNALTWEFIEQNFESQWPAFPKRHRTVAHHEKELEKLKLVDGMLGETEAIGSEFEYTHIVWARKVEMHVRGAGLYDTPFGIERIRKTLPEIIRNKIPYEFASWEMFLKGSPLTGTQLREHGFRGGKCQPISVTVVKIVLT